MIFLAILGGFVLGFFVASIWYKTADIARIELARYFDPEQPLKLKTTIDEVLQDAARKQRAELNIRYAHLSADTRELVIDNKMSELFLEMVDDLDESIRKVKAPKR